MPLPEIQRAFDVLARAPDFHDLDALARAGQVDREALDAVLEAMSPQRVQVYRELIRGAIWSTLEKCYIHTSRVLGAGWFPLCEAYLTAFPPSDWDLNSAALDLPSFLEETWLPDHPEIPGWLRDLARYECVEQSVYLGEEPDVGLLNPPSVDFPAVVGTLQVETFGVDIAGWVRQLTEDDGWPDPEPGPAYTAFFRDPDTDLCRFLNLSAVGALALQAWEQGLGSQELSQDLAPRLGMDASRCLDQLRALAVALAAEAAVDIGTGAAP